MASRRPEEENSGDAARAAIERVKVSVYEIPTDAPESDGTLAWASTTLVVARLRAGGVQGLGYGYADRATACLMKDKLAPLLQGRDAWATGQRWHDMVAALRNLGRAGICAMAVSVMDTALWDWKARRLGLPLASLLGPMRACVPVYGSGGFTSYDDHRLQDQLTRWVEAGMAMVKMKVGREPERDARRVALAREAIGPDAVLMVDANGAYELRQAGGLARRFADQGVRWFEEPVPSDDLAGLAFMRGAVAPDMAIAAGEYGHDTVYFRRMLQAGAVDVLQVDATRCGGVTGFLKAAAVCEAFGLPLSSHCAPSLHVALMCAAPTALHAEYFHDHVRIEQMVFDGAPTPRDGGLSPRLDRAGLGLELKDREAACFEI